MLLKDRFEILNKELLSVFGAVEELTLDERVVHTQSRKLSTDQGRGVHVTGVSAAYAFKLNKNILSE
jgi:hypothetical protein